MSGERITASQLNAFVDGELELGRQLEIEARLASDAALRAEVSALRELRSALHDGAEYHAAPDALRARLGQLPQLPSVPSVPPAAATARPPLADWRRWFAWRPLVPAFIVAGLVAWSLSLTLWQPGRDERLMQEVIAGHVRATVGERLVDVASSDQHTVKPWLSSRLDYSPPVADAPVPGAVFLGGRLDYLDGRPVAALVYRQRQHLIDAYVWPTQARDFAMQGLAQRGFNLVHWSRGGMSFWLVSDINRNELTGFAQALAKTDALR